MTSENSRIWSIRLDSDQRVRVMSHDQLEKVHQATLTVLEKTGVKFPSQKALEIFADAGASVNFDDQIVKIPSDLLMDALDKAPRSYTLGSRGSPELDLKIDGTNAYVRTGGQGVETVDLRTRKRRPSKKADVAMMAHISDYLSSVGLFRAIVAAQDTPPATRQLHEIEASFRNTEKHVQIGVLGEKQACYAVEIASLVAGTDEGLRKRPPLSEIICTIDPLAQDRNGIEAALIFAEAGLPVGFMSMPTMCSSAPASVAGALVIGNADILSAIALIQLAHPQTPVFYSLDGGMLNPNTGNYLANYVGFPEISLINSAGVQMGHYYDIPVLGGNLDVTHTHKYSSWRAGIENTSSYHREWPFSGADIGGHVGLLEHAMLLYPEKILFDHELFKDAKAYSEGIKVTPEDLALDEIMDVGPGGHFITKESTQKNLRKLWDPGIAQKWSPENHDFRDPHEVALEKTHWILQNHQPKPLDEKIEKEMSKIMKSAEDDLSPK